MIIDSIQGNPFQLPFQAWPMTMAPVYGVGGPLTPQGLLGSMLSGGLIGQPQLGNPLVLQSFPGSTMLPMVPLQATPTLPPPQVMLQAEQQATQSFLREATAGPIRKLHDYLETHSQKYSQLAQCIPVVQQAATAFGAQDYPQALTHIYQSYRYIAALRTSVPDLPGL